MATTNKDKTDLARIADALERIVNSMEAEPRTRPTHVDDVLKTVNWWGAQIFQASPQDG